MSQLLIFGDSLCDTGNARALLGDRAFPCPPHWANRRCNVPLWVEGLAAGLGLPPLLPSMEGGTNHAFGGARSGPGLSPKGVPNLLTQVEAFASRDQPASQASNATLAVLRAGANDYLDAPPGPAVGEAVNAHLLAAVHALADRGLRRFLVPDELPWGFSPIELPGIGEPERRAINGLIVRQNNALRQELADLAARRGLVVLQPEFHRLLVEVRAQPEAWGFREIRQPALTAAGSGPSGALLAGPQGVVLAGPQECSPPSSEPAVPDASGFLWWDAWGHLTSAFHRHLAERALGVLRGRGAAT
ncbi:MAG: SGNH/GDSL hydrolase family protein [Cyanobium sp.]